MKRVVGLFPHYTEDEDVLVFELTKIMCVSKLFNNFAYKLNSATRYVSISIFMFSYK